MDSLISNETEWLLYNLWRKPPEEDPMGSPCLDFSPKFLLADTIVCKYGKPYAWYFTSKDGTLKRKNKRNLTMSLIREAFTPKGDAKILIAASLYSFKDRGDHIIAALEHIPFANFREKLENGHTEDEHSEYHLMQKFIIPKSSQNTIIAVSWSPHMFHAEKAINNYSLDNVKQNMIDRVITIEGPDHFSHKEIIKSPSLVCDLQQACNDIAKRIKRVSNSMCNIKSMSLLFKQNIYDKLVLLACTSLKVTGIDDTSGSFKRHIDSVARYTEYQLKLDTKAKEELQRENSKEIPLNINPLEYKCKRCICCRKSIKDKELYEVNFKTIIEMFEESNLEQNSSKNDIAGLPYSNSRMDIFPGNPLHAVPQNIQLSAIPHPAPRDSFYSNPPSLIPAPVRHMYPGITTDKYIALKKDPMWLYESLRVCATCWSSIKQALARKTEKSQGSSKKADAGAMSLGGTKRSLHMIIRRAKEDPSYMRQTASSSRQSDITKVNQHPKRKARTKSKTLAVTNNSDATNDFTDMPSFIPMKYSEMKLGAPALPSSKIALRLRPEERDTPESMSSARKSHQPLTNQPGAFNTGNLPPRGISAYSKKRQPINLERHHDTAGASSNAMAEKRKLNWDLRHDLRDWAGGRTKQKLKSRPATGYFQKLMNRTAHLSTGEKQQNHGKSSEDWNQKEMMAIAKNADGLIEMIQKIKLQVGSHDGKGNSDGEKLVKKAFVLVPLNS